jgi:hypothetical protein
MLAKPACNGFGPERKQLAATGRKLKDLSVGQAKRGTLDGLSSAGRVTLNAEGMQYAASYQLRCGVITVTYGSASRVIRVGEAVAAPESLARTILKKMVTEHGRRPEMKPIDPRALRAIAQASRGGSG